MPCRFQWNIDHTDRYSSSSSVMCSCLYLLISVFETCFSSVLRLWPCGVHCSTCLAVSSSHKVSMQVSSIFFLVAYQAHDSGLFFFINLCYFIAPFMYCVFLYVVNRMTPQIICICHIFQKVSGDRNTSM